MYIRIALATFSVTVPGKGAIKEYNVGCTQSGCGLISESARFSGKIAINYFIPISYGPSIRIMQHKAVKGQPNPHSEKKGYRNSAPTVIFFKLDHSFFLNNSRNTHRRQTKPFAMCFYSPV